ncbi:hypothetical protein B566_EDAN012486 [Ephemera danica]|nr:hypothetical protein B566_EDAN012486 [Ephemera danica]
MQKFTSDFLQCSPNVVVTQIKWTQIIKHYFATFQWVTGRWVVPEQAALLGSVLKTLCSARILRAQSARQHGTQLKLLLTLEGGHRAVFKPQWYSREQVIEGPVYAGKDRHNAEVAAFHLGLLLGLRRSPLVVGRRVSLRREIMPVADRELLDTFYQEGNNTCLYGVCHYCGPHDPVCATRDLLEGALVLWLPPRVKLKKVRHPWQRTYREAMPARWEGEVRYCERVRASKFYGGSQAGMSRLLDLIDASVLDFLIDNGDRHHYELLGNSTRAAVLLLDNGKSFGNPKVDHIDILAPLYQCCMLRRSTWERLLLFTGGALSRASELTLGGSHVTPVLSQAHLAALDRRLKLVLAAVYACSNANDVTSVLV